MKAAAIAILLSLALMGFCRATQILIGYFRARRYLRGVVPLAPMQVPICLGSAAGREQLALRLINAWCKARGDKGWSSVEEYLHGYGPDQVWKGWLGVADEVTRMFVVVGGERNDNGSQAGGAA